MDDDEGRRSSPEVAAGIDRGVTRLEMRQIEYFVKVAELGGFSKAAVALNIAQSAISRQIRKLEEELGVQLLYRNGRGVALTPAGALLLEHGRIAVDKLDFIAREIAVMRESPSGNAVIGVPPSVGRMFTIPFMHRFRARYPNMKLRVVEGFTGHLLEWLNARQIDVAVLYDDPIALTGLFEPVVEEDLVCIGPASAPPPLVQGGARLADVAALPLILPSAPHGLRSYLDAAAARNGLALSVPFEVNALHSMIEAVREGLGYTILPLMAVRRELDRSGLAAWPIVDPQLTRLLFVATSGQRAGAAPIQPIARLVRAQLLDLMPEASWRAPRRRDAGAGAGARDGLDSVREALRQYAALETAGR